MPTSIHTYQKYLNPSGDPIPLSAKKGEKAKSIFLYSPNRPKDIEISMNFRPKPKLF
jgi:hypothetical protein